MTKDITCYLCEGSFFRKLRKVPLCGACFDDIDAKLKAEEKRDGIIINSIEIDDPMATPPMGTRITW